MMSRQSASANAESSQPDEPKPAAPEPTAERPWLGPEEYTEELVHLYHGRSRETQELRALVERHNITVFFGASGLGKSSLLRAGLFPELRRAHPSLLPVYLRLQHDPDAPDLAVQVLGALARERRVQAPELRGADTLWMHFHRPDDLYWSSTHRILTPVLVFDQFEELFTRGLATAKARQRSERFVRDLADLVEGGVPASLRAQLQEEGRNLRQAGFASKGNPFKVLLSLREDFLAHLEPIQKIMPSLAEARYRLIPMSPAQALDVVLTPGLRYDLLDEGQPEDVAKDIVAFVSGADSGSARPQQRGLLLLPDGDAAQDHLVVEPALLSIFCYKLNERRLEAAASDASADQASSDASQAPGAPARQRITQALLNASKGDILTDFYRDSFQGLQHPGAMQRFVEEELVSEAGFRESRSLDHVRPEEQADLKLLVKRRLLRPLNIGVAHVVELSHDVLLVPAVKQRDRRRERERRSQRWRRWLPYLSLLVPMAGITGLIWWYLSVRPYAALFDHYIDNKGQPEGRIPLSEEQAEQRPASIRIERAGRWGQVRSMEVVDHSGEPTHLHEYGPLRAPEGMVLADRGRPVRWEFAYDADGHVVREHALTQANRTAWLAVHMPESGFTEPPAGEPSRPGTAAGDNARVVRYLEAPGLAAGSLPAPEVRKRYNPEQGWLETERYFDRHGRPHPNEHAYGEFGLRYEQNPQGQVTRMFSLGPDGQPAADRFGGTLYEYALTPEGWLRDIRVYRVCDEDPRPRGCDGKERKKRVPATTQEGWARVHMAYDDAGNVKTRAYFNEHGEAARVLDGYHAIEIETTYTKPGREAPSPIKEGREERTTFLDIDKTPTHNRLGCHGYRIRYDQAGRLTERQCLGEDGKNTASAAGWASYRVTYDDEDRDKGYTTAEVSAWGDRNERVTVAVHRDLDSDDDLLPGGCHRLWLRRDAQGRETQRAYYGPEGEPVAVGGYFRREQVYKDGHLVSESYYDTTEKPVLLPDGYARVDMEYGPEGQLIEQRYRGIDGKPVRHADGYAALRYETEASNNYDKYGRLTEFRYYDARQEKPPVSTEGTDPQAQGQEDRASRTELKSETDGNSRARAGSAQAQTRTPEADQGRPHEDSSTVRDRKAPGAPEPSEADARPEEQTTIVRQPIALETGEFGESHELGPLGRSSKVTFINAEGEAVKRTDGVAGWESTWDVRGHELSRRYLDAKGKPCLHRDGYARYEAEFDAWGRETERRWLDLQDRPHVFEEGYDRVARMYDAWGKLIKEEHLNCAAQDGSCRAAKGPDGYATRRSCYDKGGHLVAEMFFGADGQPAVLGRDEAKWAKGYHRIEYAVDAQGYRWKTCYYGPPGPEASPGREYAADTAPCDGRGGPGAYPPVRRKAGEHCTLHTSEHPMTIGCDVYLDIAGRPMKRDFAAQCNASEPSSRNTSVTYLGMDGRPFTVVGGYQRIDSDYDPQGRELAHTYWSATEQPALLWNGYHGIAYEYDEWGNRTSERYLGVDNEPVKVGGYHEIRFEYDGWGNRTSDRYLGVNNEPVEMGVYHRVRREYSGDELMGQVYEDRDGNAVIGPRGYAREEREWTVSDTEPSASWWVRLFDADDHPVVAAGPTLVDGSDSEEIYAIRQERYPYDGTRLGNPQELTYMDNRKHPKAQADGCSRWTFEYDRAGRLSGGRCFVGDAPANSTDGGYHQVRYVYDDRGLLRSALYLDASGQLRSSGCYRWVYDYDPLSVLREKRCEGFEGPPRRTIYHPATWSYEPPELDPAVFRRALSHAHRGPCTTEHVWRDASQQTRQRWCLGPDGAPVEFADEGERLCVRVDNEYDRQGQRIASHCYKVSFDDEGLRCARDDRHDPQSQRAASPCDPEEHRDTTRWVYDSEGNTVSRRVCWDDQPSQFEGEVYVEERFAYDPYGRKVLEYYLDADGKGVVGPVIGPECRGQLAAGQRLGHRTWEYTPTGDARVFCHPQPYVAAPEAPVPLPSDCNGATAEGPWWRPAHAMLGPDGPLVCGIPYLR